MQPHSLFQPQPPLWFAEMSPRQCFEQYNSSMALSNRDGSDPPETEFKTPNDGLIPELSRDPNWSKFKESYDESESKAHRILAWTEAFPLWLASESPQLYEIDVLTKHIVQDLNREGVADFNKYQEYIKGQDSEQPAEEESSRETSESLNQRSEDVVRLSFFIQNLLTNREDLEQFCRLAKKRREPLSMATSNKLLLSGFLSFCLREKKLPTKKQLNQEASHWENARAIPREANTPPVGSLYNPDQLNLGPLRVIPPVYGISRTQDTALAWVCPIQHFEAERLSSKEFRTSLRYLGLQGLPQQRA